MATTKQQQQQQQHGISPPSGSGSDIPLLCSSWPGYGMSWSVRPDHHFWIAVGCFIEDYSNKVGP